ncbi:ESCRT-III subunit protein [Saccharomycopsis crataegensis]|uniref:Vacuolar-sorting protein SNF7 n=1 Tax=Saccharomycopsis crataegensis TaxID=43959 RepID=A0AAV5QUM0_9ASCO|nr:ESCRT-III subunit protein [Saccharomycopsis crataegensis]
MWSYMFGGNTQKKKEAPKKAIIQLREHITMLNKKQAHLESQIEAQDQVARKNVATNKAAAKNALKKKKNYQTQLDKIYSQIESLETQLDAIESANLNLATMNAMKDGAKAMKQIHGDFNIDKVDETMDDIKDQLDVAAEISDAISRPLGNEIDEDELEDELKELEDAQLNEELNKVAAASKKNTESEVKLPDVSKLPILNQKAPVAEEEEDEDERALRELQAQMQI